MIWVIIHLRSVALTSVLQCLTESEHKVQLNTLNDSLTHFSSHIINKHKWPGSTGTKTRFCFNIPAWNLYEGWCGARCITSLPSHSVSIILIGLFHLKNSTPKKLFFNVLILATQWCRYWAAASRPESRRIASLPGTFIFQILWFPPTDQSTHDKLIGNSTLSLNCERFICRISLYVALQWTCDLSRVDIFK